MDWASLVVIGLLRWPARRAFDIREEFKLGDYITLFVGAVVRVSCELIVDVDQAASSSGE